MKKIKNKEDAINFFREAHKEIKHKRKDGKTDYFDHHVEGVISETRRIAKDYVCKKSLDMLEVVASAHDYFEDVIWDDRNSKKFRHKKAVGVLSSFCAENYVFELTNVYTSKHFPYLNRSKRKSLEKDRLSNISVEAIIVKIADISSNSDDNPTQIWIKEKLELLDAFSASSGVSMAWLLNAIDEVREKLLKKQ